jgi:hypothetical protein
MLTSNIKKHNEAYQAYSISYITLINQNMNKSKMEHVVEVKNWQKASEKKLFNA